MVRNIALYTLSGPFDCAQDELRLGGVGKVVQAGFAQIYADYAGAILCGRPERAV